MSNRITVMSMLKKRLFEARTALKSSIQYEEAITIHGGKWDEKIHIQHRKNMNMDIEQLELLINHLRSHLHDRNGAIPKDI